jgi:hypothetical protein
MRNSKKKLCSLTHFLVLGNFVWKTGVEGWAFAGWMFGIAGLNDADLIELFWRALTVGFLNQSVVANIFCATAHFKNKT